MKKETDQPAVPAEEKPKVPAAVAEEKPEVPADPTDEEKINKLGTDILMEHGLEREKAKTFKPSFVLVPHVGKECVHRIPTGAPYPSRLPRHLPLLLEPTEVRTFVPSARSFERAADNRAFLMVNLFKSSEMAKWTVFGEDYGLYAVKQVSRNDSRCKVCDTPTSHYSHTPLGLTPRFESHPLQNAFLNLVCSYRIVPGVEWDFKLCAWIWLPKVTSIPRASTNITNIIGVKGAAATSVLTLVFVQGRVRLPRLKPSRPILPSVPRSTLGSCRWLGSASGRRRCSRRATRW